MDSMARLCTLGIVMALLSLPLVAFAQLVLTYERELTLTMVPESPGPGESVRLIVQSYAIDLDRSAITWHRDGVVIAEGVGLKEATVVAGGLGEATIISVTATDPDENPGKAEAIIKPSQIDILWSANSYVPPFYNGRTLAGTSATIHAYALVRFARAGGGLIPESDIVYTWSRNGTVISAVSGRGKSSATLAGPAPFRADSIAVEAGAADRAVSARAATSIPAAKSALLLYENHPLFGILYHRAIIGEVTTDEKEQKVTAVPYFARITTPADASLAYAWEVGGVSVQADPDEPQTLTLATNDYSGPAVISLSLTNAADILMRSLGSWRFVFGGSTGLFFDGGTPTLFGE